MVGRQADSFLNEYFIQILKVVNKYEKIGKFELFYLGHFHAICPSYKITELFHHINNINALVTEDLIDEETQIDFLIRILNKKLLSNNPNETVLNIPRDATSPVKHPGTRQSDTKHQRSRSHEKNLEIARDESSHSHDAPAFRSLTLNQNSKYNQERAFGSENSNSKQADKFQTEKTAPINFGTTKNVGVSKMTDAPKMGGLPSEKMAIEEENEGRGSLSEGEDGMRGSQRSRNEISFNDVKKIANPYQSPNSTFIQRLESKPFSFQNSFGSRDSQGLVRRETFGSDFEDINQNKINFQLDRRKSTDSFEERDNEMDIESPKDKSNSKVIELNKDHSKESLDQEKSNSASSLNAVSPNSKKYRGFETSPVVNINDRNQEVEASENEAGTEGQANKNQEEEIRTEEDQGNEGEARSKKKSESSEEEQDETFEKSVTDYPEGSEKEDSSNEKKGTGNVRSKADFEAIKESLDKDNAIQNKKDNLSSKTNKPEKELTSKDKQSEKTISTTQAKNKDSDIEEQSSNKDKVPSIEQTVGKLEKRQNSEQENQSEIERLKAQLYPGSDRLKKKGTLDDIFSGLFGTNESKPELNKSQSITKTNSMNNSLNPSLDTHKKPIASKDKKLAEHESAISPKPSITAGQIQESLSPIPTSLRQNSNQPQTIPESEHDDETNARNQQEAQSDFEASLQDSEHPTPNKPSEFATLEDHSQPDYDEIGQRSPINMSNTENKKFHKPESEASQPDSSLILKWRVVARNHNDEESEPTDAYKELLLQQVANEIQPALLEDPVVKLEENECRVLLGANTQADPTPENVQDLPYGYITSIRSVSPLSRGNPHEQNEHIDSSLRACETVKQTLSQVPRENEADDHIEMEERNEAGQSRNGQTDNKPQLNKDEYNELYGTQLSRMSSLVSKLNTLEEEKLSKEFLAQLQKERNEEKAKENTIGQKASKDNPKEDEIDLEEVGQREKVVEEKKLDEPSKSEKNQESSSVTLTIRNQIM